MPGSTNNSNVNVKLTATTSVKSYGVWLNGKAVKMVNGKGKASLKPQKEGQVCIWYAEGSPGQSFKLTVTAGTKKFVSVDRKIPAGQLRIGGTKKFKLV